MDFQEVKNNIEVLKICVIIPTYNNAATLKRVIDGVLLYTTNIIIVNDGSTDSTKDILEGYLEILKTITIPQNSGKGIALRMGFKEALEAGYDYALTIDSDGQHFPSDIPNFVSELKYSKTPNLLLIGARNMLQDSVPKKSSFGNKFSNFWFWFETGIGLKDTQSGFRLYPLNFIEKLKFFTTKFEFEIEVIVKLAWRDVEVKNIPIQVLYDEQERVSHFRPFKDFTRISILNTWFVLLAIFYIKPRCFFRRLKKKGIKRFFVENLLGHHDSPKKKALSIALGVFIGLSPFWGFHSVLVVFLAALFKLNKLIAFTFSNVSLPPFIPFIIYFSSKMGEFVLGESYDYSLNQIRENFDIIQHLKTYVLGSFILAFIFAAAFGFLGYLILSLFNKKTRVSNA